MALSEMSQSYPGCKKTSFLAINWKGAIMNKVKPSGFHDQGERITITPVHEGDAPSVNFRSDENIPLLIDETSSDNVVAMLLAVIVGAISATAFLLIIGWRLQ